MFNLFRRCNILLNHAHGNEIKGFAQAFPEGGQPARTAIVILGFPFDPGPIHILDVQYHWLVQELFCHRIAVIQCCGINKGLKYRPGLPFRLDRPVELVVVVGAPPHHGQDTACVWIQGHKGTLHQQFIPEILVELAFTGQHHFQAVFRING